MQILRQLSLGLSLLTTGLVAGFFYAYACSVTVGLNRLDDASYVAAMQAINVSVRNPVFAFSFFGALLSLSVAAAVYLTVWPTLRAQLVLLAFATYALGGFGLTLGINVPLNEQLAQVSLSATPAALDQARRAYEAPWSFWNAVRTALSTAAMLFLVVSALVPGRVTEPAAERRAAVD